MSGSGRQGGGVAQSPGQGTGHSQQEPRREPRTEPRRASVSQSRSGERLRETRELRATGCTPGHRQSCLAGRTSVKGSQGSDKHR